MKSLKFFFFTLVLMSFFILFKVNALSIYSGSIGTNQITGHDRNYNGYYIDDNLNLNQAWTSNFTLTNIKISNYDYFIFHLFFNYIENIDETGINTIPNTEMNANYSCTNWTTQTQTYADGTTSYYNVCTQWQSSTNNSTNNLESYTGTQNFNHKIGLAIDILMDDNYWSVCTIQNDSNGISTVTCPLNNNRTTINKIRIRYVNINMSVVNNETASVGVSNVYNLYRDPVRDMITQNNNNTNNIINSQNQNQQQSHQDMQDINNSLNNNNVSGANQDANSFVNNQAFQDNTGLSSIITAPLSVVNSLTNSCSPIRLNLPYMNTDIDIPCIGTLLEQKVGSLIQLVKVVINGYICYIIGLDMFKIVKHARDPDDDRIEVLDL